MFEVGKSYDLEWVEGPDHHYQIAEVLAWEHPLLKVKTSSGELIVNAASSTFVKAKEYDRQPLDLSGLLARPPEA